MDPGMPPGTGSRLAGAFCGRAAPPPASGQGESLSATHIGSLAGHLSIPVPGRAKTEAWPLLNEW
jgi:hypothetical protein